MSDHLLTALRQSTPEEQERAFAELARTVLRTHSGRPYVIRDEQQQAVGYVVSPSESMALLPTDSEWIAEMRRRTDAPSRGLTVDQFAAELTRRVAAGSAPK